MKLFLAYLAALLAFFAIDIVWINMVVLDVYQGAVGHLIIDQPRLGAAAAFYLLYVAVLVWLAVRPALRETSAATAWANGAVLGAFGYGTYSFTNFAMFGGWTWHLVWTDMLWGVVLSSVVSFIGYRAVVKRPGPV